MKIVGSEERRARRRRSKLASRWARRVGAVAISCGAACGAFDLELTSTQQEVAVVNVDNPYTFLAPNVPHAFNVTVLSSLDSDDVTAVTGSGGGCANFMIDAPNLPAHLCGAQGALAPGICPMGYSFSVTYLGTSNESCVVHIAWVESGGTESGCRVGIRNRNRVPRPVLGRLGAEHDGHPVDDRLRSGPAGQREQPTGGGLGHQQRQRGPDGLGLAPRQRRVRGRPRAAGDARDPHAVRR